VTFDCQARQPLLVRRNADRLEQSLWLKIEPVEGCRELYVRSKEQALKSGVGCLGDRTVMASLRRRGANVRAQILDKPRHDWPRQ
jgi:hypothetical protein